MLLRPAVSSLPEYVPGKAAPGAIKLSSNENPFGPSPKALKAIAAEAKRLQAYPDQKSVKLRAALAKKLKLSPDNIVCGNGLDDILQIIAATYINPGDEVVLAKNSFSVYELVCRIADAKLVWVDLQDFGLDLPAMRRAITDKTKMVFLNNPHNPTGSAFDSIAFAAFMRDLPAHVVVIVDEAYVEFSSMKDCPDVIKYVKEGKNLLLLRTFSKYFGLAGLRLGYAVGEKELIAPLLKVKMPFNVNRLAQAGGLAALEDKVFLKKTYKNNLEQKKYLYAELKKLNLGFNETEANFIYVEIEQPAKEFCQKLIALGVSVRPLTSFGFPEAIRISIGTPAQNKKLIAALKKALA